MTSNADELVQTLAPGTLLAGKYRVEQLLGTGGMGVVVAARHLHLDEIVAIKILHPQLVENADLVTRFLREGRAMIKIRSEHAVKVHDVGLLESGAPYLVMEYLDGEDLSKLSKERGPLPIESAVDLILQACEAVAEAHALGIVHRDLKPANLFLTHRADGSPCVKVLDFGISKAQLPGSNDFEITKTQVVMGSPRYMSPEQMRSARSVDHRTDIWAIGTIVYELLSGSPPFCGDTMTELCAQILQDSPTPLTQAIPNCPPALDAAIGRALAKKLPDRFQNLAELALAIAPFASAYGKISAQRIARVLKVAWPESSMGPGGTLPLDSAISAPEISTRAFSGPPASSAELPAVKTAMVWGSQTGATPTKNSNVLILLASMAGTLLVLLGIALVLFLTLRKPHPGAPAVEPTPVVAVETNAPSTSPPPAPAAAPTDSAPAEAAAAPLPETIPAPTPTRAAPTGGAGQKSSKPSTKQPASKDLPFNGRF